MSILLLTCEHATPHVPSEYRHLFAGHDALLQTHRAFDLGALALAEGMQRALRAPLMAGNVTRLLVDLNRSAHNYRAFSELTRGLPRPERQSILERYHRPHWQQVREFLEAHRAQGRRVVHIGVHSFTPTLAGEERNADVALLYDPARTEEDVMCRRWQGALQKAEQGLRVRRNYPYRGAADGLTTGMRREHEAGYLGVELELNQAYLANRAQAALECVLASLGEVLASV